LKRPLTVKLPFAMTLRLSVTGSPTQLLWLDRLHRTAPLIATPALAFLALLILLSRDPYRLFDAQLWAEDGPLWVYDSYTHGLASLLIPHTGYLQTFPRLIGFSAVIAPLTWVPTIFALAGFLTQLAPAWMLLAKRGRELIPNPAARLLLAGFYLGVPNSFETFVNITNAQWHVAMLMFLIIIMRSPVPFAWRAVENVFLFIGGLSGPFSCLLAPLAWWQAWRERSLRGARGSQAALLTLTALIQALCVAASAGSQRHLQPLGASLGGFARIVVGQIFLAAIAGAGHVSAFEQSGLWHHPAFPLLMLLVFLGVLLVAAIRGNPPFRLFLLFSALILASALWSPVISNTQPQWDALEVPGAGSRYYLLPILAWFCALLVLSGQRANLLRWPARLVIILSLIGVRTDWQYAREPETQFVAAAKIFEAAPPGTNVIFREAPNPAVWLFSLTKK
jgi:hypothetical protein